MKTTLLVAALTVVSFLAGIGFHGAVERDRVSHRSPAYTLGARFHRDSPDGGGWKAIEDAPQDGTIVEIRNNYGVAPTYFLFSYVPGNVYHEGRWVSVKNPQMGLDGGPMVQWRPFAGDPQTYVDPTHGMQKDRDYWRGAVDASCGQMSP